MEVEATVSRVEGAHAVVRVDRRGGGCGRCSEAGGCASTLLGRPLQRECRLFRLPNTIGAQPGDRVVVAVAEGSALRAALLAYLLPVLLLLAGSMLGAAFAGAEGKDFAAYSGAVMGLALAVGTVVFRAAGRRGTRFQPTLRGRIPPADGHSRVEGT